MITRIEIAGYRSIKSLALDLRPINILLGGNGVGKSNFISLFSLIRNIYNKNFQNYIQKQGGADSLLHFGKRHTSHIELTVYFKSIGDREGKSTIVLEAGQNTLFIKTTKAALKRQGTWEEVEHNSNALEYGLGTSILEPNFQSVSIYDRQVFWVDDRMEEFGVYHFHNTGDTSPMKGVADVHDNKQLRRDGSNLAAFLYYLKEKQPKYFQRIEMTVKSIAPFLDRFVLEPRRLNEQTIELEWREKDFPDAYFNAYHLSDGTLRFICLATLLMQPDPPETIIIDEPELGLHPVAINKLAALVRKASEKNQIILSTQSINLIDNFEPEDIIVTNRENHGSVFRRLRSEELRAWLGEYTLGDLWGQNKLGAQPYSV